MVSTVSMQKSRVRSDTRSPGGCESGDYCGCAAGYFVYLDYCDSHYAGWDAECDRNC